MDLTRGYALDEAGQLIRPGVSEHVYDWNCLMGEALPLWLQEPKNDGTSASTGSAYSSTAHDTTHPGYLLINTGSTLDAVARLATKPIPMNQYAAIMFQCFGVQFDNSNGAADDLDDTISFGIHSITYTGGPAGNAGARVIQRGATAFSIALTTAGVPTGGSYTLRVSVDGGTPQTTGAILHNASTSALDAALEALPNVGAGTVTVTGSVGNYTITFSGALAGKDVWLSLGTNSLTGGASPTVNAVATRDSNARFVMPGVAGDHAPFGASFRTLREGYRFRNMGFLLYRSGQAVYFEDDPSNPIATLDAAGIMATGNSAMGALMLQTKTAANAALRLGGVRLTLWREPETI